MWAADLADLAAVFRVVAYNRRGYGRSSGSPRNWRAHGDDAVALIQELNAAPAAVIGYSGGAMVALDAALKRPDLIRRLVLLDPAVNLKRCITPGFVKTIAAVKLLRRLRGDRVAAETWFRYVSSYSTGGSGFEAASDARREELATNVAGLFADLSSGGSAIDENMLAGIDVPVTIVDAALSPTFLRRSSHRLEQIWPRADKVTLERSGHWIALDAHDDLLRILRDAAR